MSARYTEEDLLNTLLNKIYTILASPDSITGVKNTRSFFSVCMPGIPLAPAALDFGFTTMSPDQLERAADFSELVNIIPQWGSSWRSSGRKLTEEYKKIIKGPILPKPIITDAEKKRYEEAKKFLFTTTQIQDPNTGVISEIEVQSIWQSRYDEFELAHAATVGKYHQARAEYLAHMNEPGQAEKWAALEPILRARIVTAFKKWEAAGKNKVEEAWGIIGNLDNRGLESSWQDRRARFDAYKKGAQVGDFWLTKYYPGKFWDDTAGWLDITLTHNEVHKVNEAEQTSWGGGGSASFGLWRVGGDASYESQKTMAKCDTDGFSISFQLAQVPLLRGWLDSDVFSSRSWKFDSGVIAPSENLSDGNIPPSGTMPMYPTGMVLVRNVKLNFNKSSELNKTFMETVRGSTSVGWGPFSARANYYKRIDKSSHDFVEDAAGLEIKGMQILGFMCTLLDKSPNPDEDLNW
ncbi:hypothetical protein [Delftia acidovorans]